IALGHKLYDEIVLRLPTPPGDGAIPDALKRLKLQDEASLMEAIARRQFTDFQVMEALMPGSTEGEDEHDLPPQQHAIEIKGLTPGV
ncbi:bifunctional (p)ppGpp synthetase/guanosine-3',5'-bis(diphosphate) 3'-pyrophosphohydrolase, partial [Escherichia marmotae]|nr:bifunctional (p)ppGpp synthetase/guanosine-3',5'-bis(diphosphate) 3'-pyrophosphohydrolase [Escherichia marmotae]